MPIPPALPTSDRWRNGLWVQAIMFCHCTKWVRMLPPHLPKLTLITDGLNKQFQFQAVIYYSFKGKMFLLISSNFFSCFGHVRNHYSNLPSFSWWHQASSHRTITVISPPPLLSSSPSLLLTTLLSPPLISPLLLLPSPPFLSSPVLSSSPLLSSPPPCCGSRFTKYCSCPIVPPPWFVFAYRQVIWRWMRWECLEPPFHRCEAGA